jgi:protein-tyrosine kinase
MSRIDEALRRAAMEERRGATDELTTAAVTGRDVADLAREPFPIEIGERLRARGHSSDVQPVEPASSSTRTEAPPAPQITRLSDRIDSILAEKVVADENMAPVPREQYRRLAAVLHDLHANRTLSVLMVASAMPGEGKTLTATNLALTFSESYHDRVLLIDADLRRPTLHQVFQLDAGYGLLEGLETETDAKLVVRQVSSRLAILPAGRSTSDPMAALTSPRMRQLLDEAKETFDWVILDTPPLMLLPDAHLLSALVDGAVLVIRANSTPFELVKRSAEIIGRQRIAGVVLNHADERAQAAYGNYYSKGYYLRPNGTEPT